MKIDLLEIIELNMKSDLTKTLTISGMSGLYRYISQARNGAIVESLVDGKRTCVGITSKMTALEDISIYTDDEEVKLRQVLLNLHEVLGGEAAPSSKSDASVLKELFEKALPNYDRDRFYVSHMKKVVDWYNCLLKYASFDFEDEQEGNNEQAAE